MAGAWRAVLLLLPKQSLSSPRYQSSPSRALSSSGTTATGTSRPPKSSCQIYEDDQLAINAGELPLPVWNTMLKLRAAGHTVLLVGGAVRDLLLGTAPKDWDLLTSAHLAEVKQLVPKSSVFGRNFPICQLLVQGVRIEVSSMHTRPHSSSSTWGHAAGSAGVPPDAAQILQAGPKAAAAAAAAAAGGAQIGRHRRSKLTSHHHNQQQQQQQQQQPQLSWAAARRENALGRDFTVNCLMYDPFAGLLFDYVQGVPDIHAGILRCNGDPASRFSRDPACMLRAVRCAARAGLALEQHTQAALQQHGHLLHTINRHRMTAELMALLGYGAAAASLQLLAETRLLQHVLPLHASYMHRHAQARSTHSISSRQGIAAAPDGGVSTHRDCSEQSSSGFSCSSAAESSQLPCSEQSPGDTEQQAFSALGVLWNTAPCQQQQQIQQQQQQQQLRQQLQQQRQSLDQANLLLRVLAALDQHVSVSQPAQPEVVLSCLTLPLLVEVLDEAVILLKQQQQQQQMQQQHRYQQHAMLAEDPAAAAVASRELCQPQQHLFEGALGLNHAGADLTLLLRAAPTARSIARPFSSSSSSSHPEGLQFACSSSSRSMAYEFVQQLVQGVHLEECMRQQAAHLAAMVCQPSAVNGESSQEPTHPFNQLFGAHTPKLAADLLAGQLQLSKQQPPGTAPQQQASQHAPQDTKHTTSSRCGTRQQLRQQPGHFDLWDEHAAALPRSNKQFRRLMQRQWDQQLPGAEAGLMGTLAPQEVLLAAADAGRAADHRAAGINSDRHCQQQATGVDSSQLLQRVLETASVDLGEMEEQLQAALVHVHG